MSNDARLTTVAIYGDRFRMTKVKKITAHVPVELLRRARIATGRRITETVRLGLDLLASAKAAQDLRRLRGKVHLDLEELRKDLSRRAPQRKARGAGGPGLVEGATRLQRQPLGDERLSDGAIAIL